MNDTPELNLTLRRSPASVWDRPAPEAYDKKRQQLAVTRWLTVAGGAALMIQALRRRSPIGWMLAGASAGLSLWALNEALTASDRSRARRWLVGIVDRVRPSSGDRVFDESADSFPASDAPSWTPTIGAGHGHHDRPR
jgi:hypothetical protein